MPLLVASSVWGSEDRLLSIPPPRYTFSSSFSGDNLQFVAPVFNAERFAIQINEIFVGRFCSVVYSNDSHCDAPNIVVGQKAAGARTLRGFRFYTPSGEQIANNNRLRIVGAA